MAATALEVADQLFRNLEAKNAAGVAALYHDDIAVWHNFSMAGQTREANLAILGDLIRNVSEIRYEVLERHDLGGKVVQRHNLRCRIASGREFVIPACIFITVDDGRIRRIEEYLDTAQANALREATGRARIQSAGV